MTGGLLAPLSPQEEVALRRVAHGSFFVDAQAVSRLLALALIESTGSGLRLTPIGRLRYDALPKAPLLGRQRSIQAVGAYIDGVIEKAQSRAAAPDTPEAASVPMPMPVPGSASAHLLAELETGSVTAREGASKGLRYQPVYFFFDSEHWKARAESAMARTRRTIMEHRQRHVRLCDTSNSRIETSRSLLKESVPVRPSWLRAVIAEL